MSVQYILLITTNCYFLHLRAHLSSSRLWLINCRLHLQHLRTSELMNSYSLHGDRYQIIKVSIHSEHTHLAPEILLLMEKISRGPGVSNEQSAR